MIEDEEIYEQWKRYRSEIWVLLKRRDIAETDIQDYFSKTTLKEMEERNPWEDFAND